MRPFGKTTIIKKLQQNKSQESNTIIVFAAPIQLAALCGPHTPHTPRYSSYTHTHTHIHAHTHTHTHTDTHTHRHTHTQHSPRLNFAIYSRYTHTHTHTNTTTHTHTHTPHTRT